MPINKNQNRKNLGNSPINEAKIPQKDFPHKTVEIKKTGATFNKRVTALATVGKKKKPK